MCKSAVFGLGCFKELAEKSAIRILDKLMQYSIDKTLDRLIPVLICVLANVVTCWKFYLSKGPA